VFAWLDKHPEAAPHPAQVVEALHVNENSAKRLCIAWRKAHATLLDDLLGPVLLQNFRISGRTLPGTSPSSSQALQALGEWQAQGDGKLAAEVPIPPDGHAKVLFASGGSLDLYLAGPRGLTPAEVRIIAAILNLPFDKNGPFTLQYEMLRDGRTLTFEGLDCRTYQDVDGHLVKLYNHTDERGTRGRVEIRPPSVKASWPEIEAFLEARQPLGRDRRIEALTAMARDNSIGIVGVKREQKQMNRNLEHQGILLERLVDRLERLGGSLGVRPARMEKEPSVFVQGSEANWAQASTKGRRMRRATTGADRLAFGRRPTNAVNRDR
jgi:hypothetical protein